MSKEHIAVLLMAYGSPNGLDEVEAYLLDIRQGRPSSPAAVKELKDRYRRVGPPTPLLRVTRELALKLERALGESFGDSASFSVHVGMKHWIPRIATAVLEIERSGADRLVGVVLAPHYSRISIGGYRKQVEQALGGVGHPISLDFVERWHDLPDYLQTVAENVREELGRFSEPRRMVVIFTAHSLPARILAEGDPYKDQLLFSAEQIARRAGADRWEFSFQSQSQTGEPWLGPDLLETLERLARSGERQVLVAPIGFVTDHLEILFDIDVEAREKAAELGLELRRTRMLNADPRFVAALAGLVSRRVTYLSPSSRS